jgi:hypothetical protein
MESGDGQAVRLHRRVVHGKEDDLLWLSRSRRMAASSSSASAVPKRPNPMIRAIFVDWVAQAQYRCLRKFDWRSAPLIIRTPRIGSRGRPRDVDDRLAAFPLS